MICSKCKNDGVRNEVMGETFYYCRTCKEEIQLEVVNTTGITRSGGILAVNGNGPTWVPFINGVFPIGGGSNGISSIIIPLFIPEFQDINGLEWSVMSDKAMSYPEALRYAKDRGGRLPTHLDSCNCTNAFIKSQFYWFDNSLHPVPTGQCRVRLVR